MKVPVRLFAQAIEAPKFSLDLVLGSSCSFLLEEALAVSGGLEGRDLSSEKGVLFLELLYLLGKEDIGEAGLEGVFIEPTFVDWLEKFD